jgi:hypothetical protein
MFDLVLFGEFNWVGRKEERHEIANRCCELIMDFGIIEII